MQIELNRVYTFEITNLAFGDLSNDIITELFKDGRVASFFLEKQLCEWFPELNHITGNKPYDHICDAGKKYDAKSFTKRGLVFMPSNQVGSGRTFSSEVTLSKIKEHGLTYILCDIESFPVVNVRFSEGEALLEQFPKGKITKKQKPEVFA